MRLSQRRVELRQLTQRLPRGIVGLQVTLDTGELQRTPTVERLDTQAAPEELRGAALVRDQSYIRLANGRVAVRSAESHAETSYTFSGGVAGTTQGRVAVTIAFTLVFGVIAIYTLEWLSQLRRQGDS